MMDSRALASASWQLVSCVSGYIFHLCSINHAAWSCVVRKPASWMSFTAKVPSDIAHLHGRFVLCNFTSVTWSVSNRCGLGSHLIALGAVPSLFHPQTATLYLELVHAFCFRRYPIAASECVKVLQNCVWSARRRAPRRLAWRSAAVSLLTCLNPAVVGKDHS